METKPKEKKKIRVTIKDLNKVVSEVMSYAGTLDKYDRNELRDIIGSFGIEQFNRGFKFGQRKLKQEGGNSSQA